MYFNHKYKRVGPCTDCGGPSYCGWTPSAWQACDVTCNGVCSGNVQGVSTVLGEKEEKGFIEQFLDVLTTPSIRGIDF